MVNVLTNDATRLATAEIVRLAAPRGVRIACDAGLVWVTAQGRRSDYWLVAGEAVDIDHSRSVVIEAAQSSAIRVLPSLRAARFPWLQRWRRALRGARASAFAA